jgi:hypothetical protein
MRSNGMLFTLLVAGVALAAGAARGGDVVPPSHWEDHPLASGRHDGAGGAARVAFEAVVRVADAPWLRLQFAECQLGAGSAIVCSSLEDGAGETLDAAGLESRRNGSAYFNGEAIRLRLLVAPEDAGVFFNLDRVLVGERPAGGGGRDRSLCGDDDRVHSDDPAVGRMPWVTATAWISSIAALLSAGHACDDQGVMDVVQFNVPLSDPDGTMNHPPPEHQYPIDMASILYNDDGEGEIGDDW